MRIIFTCLFLSITMLAQAGGIKFFKGTWEEALAAAKQQDKIIFVDAYTTWCGPCKMMSAQVFPNSDVGNYYNENFINMKIDMEKGEGRMIAQKYKVRAYPTFLYIGGDGKKVHEAKGFKKPDSFIKIGEFAVKKNDKSIEYAKQYEEGKKDADFLRKYAYALLRARKPHIKVANEYFATQKDLTSEVNLKAYFDFATEADSRIFDLMVKNKTALIKMYSAEAFDKKILSAANATVKKAIEFNSTDLLATAKSAVKNNLAAKSTEFGLEADMTYYAAVKNGSKYMKAAKKYAKKHAGSNAVKLHELAATVNKSFDDTATLTKAEKWAATAVENGGKSLYYYTHADILRKIGKKSAALSVAKKGLELASKEGGFSREFQRLINEIEKKA